MAADGLTGAESVIAYLWEAGDRYSGITDDPEYGRETAAERLKPGDAARVESAMAWLGADGYAVYFRTGEGWNAMRPRNGAMTWEQIAAMPKRTAS